MRTAHAAVGETSAPSRVPSLLEQIGGHEGVAALVATFASRMHGDEELAPALAQIDPATLDAGFLAFFTHALGGDVPAPTRGVWLEPEAFGRVAVHLWSTLLEFDAPDDLKNLVTVALVQRAIGYDDV